MMHLLSILMDLVVAGYVIWEVMRFGPQYRQLKRDLANGDVQARSRMVLGTAGFVIARIRSKRRGAGSPPARPRPWRKLLPDFWALVPSTRRERLLWLAVAASAGICEEIVFRGWLLFALHGGLRLDGIALFLAAAVLFGLAHSYQGVTGVLLATFAGALFCGLYVATGSLLMPIALHTLVDARFAVLPAPKVHDAQAQYA